MKQVEFHGRRAGQIENEALRLVVTREGGHVAAFIDKTSGVSPLWIPQWASIEPSQYSAAHHPEYGGGPEAQLLAGILGHNVCLDLFGGPDQDEAAVGIPVHGEAPVVPYQLSGDETHIVVRADLPKAQLSFERQIELAPAGVAVFSETVQNLASFGRPIGWTQHVTLGAPFLERGQTRFAASATQSRVFDGAFNEGLERQLAGAEFTWPLCPLKAGGVDDLSTMTAEASSGGFTAHLMDPAAEQSFFVAWSPHYQLAFGYVWTRRDFPWLGRWEENHLRAGAPWNSAAFALGMEFGVSPMPESRRSMVARGSMFATPTYFWIPARGQGSVRYCAFLRACTELPETVTWDGDRGVTLL